MPNFTSPLMFLSLMAACGAGTLNIPTPPALSETAGAACPQERLTDEQQQTLQNAKGKLRRVTANVNLARSTAGSGDGPLSGSRAKLTKVRLGNAPAELKQVRDLVQNLPPDNGEVNTFLASLATLQDSIDHLQARLDGKTAPARTRDDEGDTEKATSTPSPSQSADQPERMNRGNVKLDYRQRDALKKTTFNLRDVEGSVSRLKSLTQNLRAIGEPSKIPFREVASGVSTLKEAQRKFGWTIDSIKGLPAEGEGVAPVQTRIQAAESELKQAAEFLLPLHQKLSAMVDPSSYPELQSDLKRIQEIAQMFSNTMLFLSNRAKAAETVKQAQPAAEEAQRLADKYAVLVQQQSTEGKALDRQIKYLVKKKNEFLDFGKQQAVTLPAEIEKHLARAGTLAVQAVENQKPMFFMGGIPQEVGFAEEKLGLLDVLDAKAAAQIAAKIKTLKSELANAQEKLSQKIIDENQLPADRFRGPDREQAIKIAVDAWKHQQSKFQLLATRIPGEAWSRETMWQYSNGTWYFVDRSKLQVRLVVADPGNEKLAVIRPVTVIKDHQKGDSMIGVPLWNIKDKLQPNSYLLRSKVK